MCTRVLNNLNRKYIATARNMDWMFPLPTSLFTFDKGLNKIGMPISDNKTDNEKALKWCSKYASVVAMVGDEQSGWASSDGMNSMGLAANVLYDCNATYAKDQPCKEGQLSVLRWVQYVLDNFVFVKEVVSEFEQQKIELVSADVPNSDGKPATLHLSISDVTGNSAIIEVYNGQFYIHSKDEYVVMTNDPSYDKQLKIDAYWKWQWSDENIAASHTIPGGPFSADRFERALFYISHMNAPTSHDEALAQAKSVVANACVPLGYNVQMTESPNISNTLWTTLVSHNEQKYYFSNARTTNTVWVDLQTFDFNEPVKRLDMVTISSANQVINNSYEGQVNELLTPVLDPYSPNLFIPDEICRIGA
ncbi:linear amide C-N hydrolase [Pseudoalteromonas umbrosa]|uniref:linear amide C-N hydrolase n=1 Tax=Pseudoalteromonas umbrosa TaxID=3048489 RepID=UPI0024C2C599|nr:linear amide C-N hydrolase [Pseudoalteromonas sp. B95]MDK1285811.1 linear amide C-N hydrolase [Pseudoalteromonas sp. B95]